MEDFYIYTPLDEDAHEIRLLTLLPAEFDAPVQGTLRCVPLMEGNVPEYEALSYFWGSLQDPVTILIRNNYDDGQKFEQLPVTQNLAHALPYLRYTNDPRILWIDSICANQQDLEERSSQVKRMADVYTLAERVVVWLGEESHNSSATLKDLESLGQKINVDWGIYKMTPSTQDSTEAHWADYQVKLPHTEAHMLAITELLGRPWFERLWVWQEIQMASEKSIIMCGRASILWHDFRKAILCLFRKGSSETGYPKGYRELRNQAMELCDVQVLRTFDALAEASKFSKCSDPRDRVFALLSLVWGKEQLGCEPSYVESVKEVYQDIFLRQIDMRGNLEPLMTCELRTENGIVDLPSWTPDLSVPRLSRPLQAMTTISSSLERNVETDKGVLKVQGKTLAIVQNVYSNSISPGSLSQETPVTILNLASNFDMKSPYISGGTKFEAFFRVLIANHHTEAYPHPILVYPNERKSFDNLEKLLDQKAHVTLAVLDNLSLYLEHARVLLLRRSVFVTAEEYMGLAPDSTQSGDELVAIVGCSAPMILRPVNDCQRQIVGEAYCHGLNHGEPFLGPLPEGIEALQSVTEEGHTMYVLFRDRKTGETSIEDPRLGALPEDWRREGYGTEQLHSIFVNTKTGERLVGWNADPRTMPKELEKRGVKLEAFELV